MNKLLVAISFILILLGCEVEEKEKKLQQGNEHQQLAVVATNLQAPWAIEKDGAIFYVTERTGSIVRIEDEQMMRQHVVLSEQLSEASEAGLLGFALAPTFRQTNEAFAYYTYNKGNEQFNRVVVLRLEGNVWKEDKVLLDQIPSGTYHHGGRLKMGPDDKLYITVGDASNPALAQDQHSLAGKILRMNIDGTIPDDNPFTNSYIYSYGHRNPQGLAWSDDGVLYASEHGQSANDEVNKIQAGNNYGWPLIEGEETKKGYVTPQFTSSAYDTWAPSGMVYYKGLLYVAALRGTALLEFDLQTGQVKELIKDVGRVRDVWLDEEALYFITNNTDGRGQPSVTDDHLYKLKWE